MLCEDYNNISKSSFAKYKEAEDYLKSLNCSSWDHFEHAPEENKKFEEAYSLRYHSALTATVFQALAVEAFINLYGAQRLGEKTYYTEYEKKGATIEGKMKKICSEYLESQYPTNDKAYSRLISLMKKRDKIVHTKPNSVAIDGTRVSYDDFMSHVNFIYKDLDEEIMSYDILKKNLMKIEGNEIDLIQESTNMIQNAISEKIIEMLNNGLIG